MHDITYVWDKTSSSSSFSIEFDREHELHQIGIVLPQDLMIDNMSKQFASKDPWLRAFFANLLIATFLNFDRRFL